MTASHKSVTATDNLTVTERQVYNLLRDIKELDVYLKEEGVSDIMINPDGRMFIRKALVGRQFTGITVDSEKTRRIIFAIASMTGKIVNTEDPVLEAILPLYNCRVHAFVEPFVKGPSLAIRVPPRKQYSLADYIVDSRMTESQYEAISEGIAKHENIMIGGGTGSGKTTLLSAMINEISLQFPDERLYIVEDVEEIVCNVRDFVQLCVPPHKTVDAVRGALRYNPDRIIFGELRYGDTALALCKAWNTGHPGGLSTAHADSARSMIPRLTALIGEAVVGSVDTTLIHESINMCVFLSRNEHGPYVKEIIRLVRSNESTDFNIVEV